MKIGINIGFLITLVSAALGGLALIAKLIFPDLYCRTRGKRGSSKDATSPSAPYKCINNLFTQGSVAGALNHPPQESYFFDLLSLSANGDMWTLRTNCTQTCCETDSSLCLRFHSLLSHSEVQDKPRGITAEHAVLHHVIISCKYSVDVTPKRSTYVYVTFIYRNAPLRGKYMSLGCLIRIQTCKGARAKW